MLDQDIPGLRASEQQRLVDSNTQGERLIQAIQHNSLRVSDLRIIGDGVNTITVIDPSKPPGKQKREGLYFVRLPDELVEAFPGSVIGPRRFLQEIGETDIERVSALLLSSHMGSKTEPIYTFRDGNFTLNVFHGAMNPHSLEMTRLAAIPHGADNEEVRREYQSHQFMVISPVLGYTSLYDKRVADDCGATGETVVGILTLMAQRMTLPLQGKVRVDLTDATTQSILTIREFARQNNIEIEVNTGTASFGLTEGKEIESTTARGDANYITHPDEVLSELPPGSPSPEEYRSADGNIYKVGDMGDLAKSLGAIYDELCPWNAYRNDSHGNRGSEPTKNKPIRNDRPPTIYLRNGGLLIYAFDDDVNPIVATASRVWSSDKGYGVLVKDI